MKWPRPGSSSIRWSLIRSFSVIVLVSSLTVLALTTLSANRTERELSARLISAGTAQATRALDSFLEPARKFTQLGVSWGEDGKLSLANAANGESGVVDPAQVASVASVTSTLLPILLAFEELSSVQIGNERGEGLMILETDEEIRIRVVNPARWGSNTLWFSVDASGQPVRPSWRTVDYDPRRRDWYRGIKDASPRSVAWTNPYIFFTTRELGITASGAWLEGGVQHVIAWDVLLSSVTAFTSRLAAELSPRSSILVMTPDKRVIGLPRHRAYLEPDSWAANYLEPVVDLVAPETRALMAASKGLKLPVSIYFKAGELSWWAGLREYRIAPGRVFEIAVMVPDIDLLRDLHRQRLMILFATMLALVAALVFSLMMARSYSRPLEALAGQSRKIRELDFSPNAPVRADFREVRELANTQAQSLTALQSFSRYVPTEVVSELVKTNEVAQIGGQSREITVLFTDIAGFTAIAENAAPDLLAEHLAVYFEAMINALHQHGATVDKLIGDSIMAFWGAPRRDEDHRANAVRGVSECRRSLQKLNAKWRDEGRFELVTRFGLATGHVLVGNFGAPNRLAYTVFGDTVNLASRLEGLNKMYGTEVLADESVLEKSRDAANWRRIDRVRVLGRSAPVWIYELLDESADLAAASEYARAWDAYSEAKFDEALSILSRLQSEPPDPVVQRLRRICESLAAGPLPDGWDPVTDIDRK